MKLTGKEVESESSELPAEEHQCLSECEEDILQVDVDPSELMGEEKLLPTLWFGSSLVTPALVKSYVGKGYFGAGVCRAPEGEETPDPRIGECVFFRDFFVAGLRFPIDLVVQEILSRFKLAMHHLTPMP